MYVCACNVCVCIQLHARWLFLTGTSTGSDTTNESAIFVILGLVGGIVSLVVCSILLCIVIMYMYIRYCNNKKRMHAVDEDVAAKSNLDVTMNTNPSYNITEQNQEHQYDYVFHKEYSLQENTQDVVKMESDPAYGGIQDRNPTLNNLPEFQYNDDAAIHKECSLQENTQDVVKMESNPAYGGTQDLNPVLNNLPEFRYNDDAAIHKEYSLQENTQDVIKMESDPAYGGTQDLNPVLNNLPEIWYNDDATIHPNLPCSCNLETTKTSEDEDEDQHAYGYVKTDLQNSPQGADYLELIEYTFPV